MSKGARIAIGIVSLIGAFGFWLTAQDTEGLPSGPLMFYGLTTFFILIAIAMFFRCILSSIVIAILLWEDKNWDKLLPQIPGQYCRAGGGMPF